MSARVRPRMSDVDSSSFRSSTMHTGTGVACAFRHRPSVPLRRWCCRRGHFPATPCPSIYSGSIQRGGEKFRCYFCIDQGAPQTVAAQQQYIAGLQRHGSGRFGVEQLPTPPRQLVILLRRMRFISSVLMMPQSATAAPPSGRASLRRSHRRATGRYANHPRAPSTPGRPAPAPPRKWCRDCHQAAAPARV